MSGADAHATGDTARFGSGQPVRRIEDPALVAGQGRYTDDLRPEGLLHLVFVRSPHAHARILSVDTTEARAADGVVAVWTGADLVAAGVKPMPLVLPFKRPGGGPLGHEPRRQMAVDLVRYVGEAVAAVVATSRALAERAAERVMVDYDMLPAVADAHAALLPGAPVVCAAAPDNITARKTFGDAAATAVAFGEAAHVVKLELHNQRLAPSSIEPRVILAEIDAADGGRLVVHLASQGPTGVRDGLCATLPGRTAQNTRVRVHDVGGGFGMKTGLYIEDVVVAFAATQLGRPVKWRGSRLEEFSASVHGRDLSSQAELALDAEGRILGLRIRSVANVGAYATGAGLFIPMGVGPLVTTSVYDVPALDLEVTGVLTHTTPVGPYRGAGRPEAIYIMERLMDAAARQLGMDPVVLRRRNLIRPEQMPYTNAMAQVYDVGAFEQMLDQALALADWDGYAARQAASLAAGRLRGRAVVTFLEWTSANVLTEEARVRVLPEGLIEITTATQAMGQGIATSYAQLAVDVFGVPIERIRIVQGDTDQANGFGSGGSRSLFTGGGAVQVVAQKTVEHGKDLAAQALEAPAGDIEYREGRFEVVGTDLGIGLFDLAAQQGEGAIVMNASASASAPSWPNACHVAEVEIDRDTGAVEVVAYASVNDIGRVVSPVIVQGQIEGGVVQGIGQALCERVAYDAEGQLLSASYMDYALPRVDGYLDFRTRFDTSVPCKTNRLGVKGVGELGTIGATPVVVNAVLDALASAGLGREVEALQMPLTAPRVWRALQGHTHSLPDGRPAEGPVFPLLPC